MASEYTADMIQVLTWTEAMRKRPGMDIRGLADGSGPLHLLLTVVVNAIDQVLLGRCTRVEVRVEADDFVTVADDGPGIPAHAILEFVERPSRRSTAEAHRPRVHFELRGHGLPVVAALSDPFEIDTVHAGEQATVAYAGGRARAPLRTSAASRPSGTRVRFRPDPEIFHCTRLPRAELTQRLEDLAFLLPPMALTWRFAGEHATGLVARVRAEAREPVEVAYHQGDWVTEDGPTTVEVALAWRTRHHEQPPQVLGFVNLRRAEDGPPAKASLAGVRDFLKVESRGDHGLEGLVAAVAVRYDDTRYATQTMQRLAGSALHAAVKDATSTALQRWAERDPAAADALRRRAKAR